eukprot:TRINITY_DN3441_c0_g1_i5.p1 TRINITY_DN3441_c0_g1~~TRINITY_DN3441_c0_g1_i5.p1  ORF type:complete len:173 (+),score=20.61 TRINITY_DN3441_c0_g1_i5:40-558(+)
MEAPPELESEQSAPAEGGSLGSVLQSATFLHRFGLYLEQNAPQLRPLLYFCVDVERLRQCETPEQDAALVCDPAACEHIVWTYLKRGSPRSLHRCEDPRLSPVPDPDDSNGEIVLPVLLEIQARAQEILQQDLLPGFMEAEGAHLAGTDREALAVHAPVSYTHLTLPTKRIV